MCVHVAEKKSTADIFVKTAQILNLDSYDKKMVISREAPSGRMEGILSSTTTFSSSHLALSPLTFSFKPSAFGSGD
jgi:hypothetical protein